MIVDDNQEDATRISEWLHEDGYTNVHIAHSGVQCLDLLAEKGEEIHAVLLDFRMPGMTGMEVLRHLVQVHLHIVGVTIISVVADRGAFRSFLELRTDTVLTFDYLLKPLSKTEVLLEVERTLHHVERKRRYQANTLAGNLGAQLYGIERKLQSLDESLDSIKGRVAKLTRRVPNFLGQLGLEIVRLILLSLALLGLYYLSLSDLLRSLIERG